MSAPGAGGAGGVGGVGGGVAAKSWLDDRGATSAEYALLLALLVVAIVAALVTFGPVLADLLRSYPDLSSS